MPLPQARIGEGRSRSAELYKILKAGILNGELEPGERLVEESIARFYSVSRTPVREVLHKLTIDGLVTELKQGLVVAEVSIEEFADLCAVREVLEGMAARLSASSRSDLDATTLQSLVEQQREATADADLERLKVISYAIHESIANASKNRYLTSQLSYLRHFIEQRQGSTLTSDVRRKRSLDEHERLVAAIVAKDADLAEEIAREHMEEILTVRLMMKRMPSTESRES